MPTIILRPNATGTNNGIPVQVPNSGSHWDKVDEASADDLTTWIYNIQTSYLTDTFNIEDGSIPSGSTINSVKVYFRIRSTPLLNGYFKPILVLGSSTTTGSEIVAYTGGNFVDYSETLSRPGGGSWSDTDIASLEVGISMRISLVGNAAGLTQIYVEVDYTLPTPPLGFVGGSMLGHKVLRTPTLTELAPLFEHPLRRMIRLERGGKL